MVTQDPYLKSETKEFLGYEYMSSNGDLVKIYNDSDSDQEESHPRPAVWYPSDREYCGSNTKPAMCMCAVSWLRQRGTTRVFGRRSLRTNMQDAADLSQVGSAHLA